MLLFYLQGLYVWFVDWALVCDRSFKDGPCKDTGAHLSPPQTPPPLGTYLPLYAVLAIFGLCGLFFFFL